MKKIITGDRSLTFHNKEYDECYHSVSGAIEEAFEKFAKPCKLKDGMKVLDICFGIGYNSLAAISSADVGIVALESDAEILSRIDEIKVDEKLQKDYNKIKKAAKKLEYSDDKISIGIILGDARETIKKVNGKFDAVFLDPFSPKKCPVLWTEEFFSEIAKRMKKGAVLATYSCAAKVRENLKSAGFNVTDGPCVGRKSPSTIAYLK